MERPVIEGQIIERLKKTKKGTVYFADDFFELGNQESINRALSRLKEKKVLIRLGQGIYLYPQVDKDLGVLYPSLDEVAGVIAKRDKARIIPTGIQALNLLGLSTQVPMKVIYLTDGSPRSVRVGKRNIQFKKTAPKNLSVKGTISGLVIQALREIGNENATGEQLKKINGVLKKEKPEAVAHDMQLAPAWIREIMKSAIKK